MIRSITCSGFKSFDGFSIDFRPGLNVIVGPNGSGKTNIILFLQFLGSLRRSSLIEAIGQVGGAGSVFRREALGLRETIEFEFSGSGMYHQDYSSKSMISARYIFSATIKLDLSESTVVFAKQHLRIWTDEFSQLDLDPASYTAATVDIEFELGRDGSNIINVRALRPENIRYSHKGDVAEAIREVIEVSQQYGKSVILIAYLDRVLSRIDYPDQDLWGAQSYNILPERVRAPEDVARIPVVQPDGSGLAATLHALQTQAAPVQRRHAPIFMARREISNADTIRKQIIEYSKLVNDGVEDIRVTSDPLEGKLRISMVLQYENYSSVIPFSLVSDGTAKWFALVTAVMTNPRLFAIEEPENFLHPAMQSEIVNLVRSQYNRIDSEGFAIITTHSETILNNTLPEELIIVSMQNGRTIASRPDNAEDISEEISRTGFGLGYYYLAGAIE